jgi:hypothetical protein
MNIFDMMYLILLVMLKDFINRNIFYEVILLFEVFLVDFMFFRDYLVFLFYFYLFLFIGYYLYFREDLFV